MRFYAFTLSALICLELTIVIPARAQLTTGPTTQTAATTQPIDRSTPKAAMLSYDRQAGAGPEAFVPFFHTSGPVDEELVQAVAHTDSMLGMLQAIVEQKWGNDGVDTVLHAFGSKTRSDMYAATVQVNAKGDRALFSWSDDGPPVTMVRVKGDWKIDASAYRRMIGIPVDDYAASLRDMSPVISDVADAIDDGTLTTPEAAAAEVKRRLTPPH